MTAPVTKAAASDARNWYAPTRSLGFPQRCCAVWPRISSESCGWSIQPSASGESNQPGATTFTVMPAGARSSASPFAMPTSPAFEALYAESPSRGRSPSTEPVKISRPPSVITRAAARAPRNAPVRFTSITARQTAGSVSRGPATIGEMPALQIQTSTPPHAATVESATSSLNSASVTSPPNTRDGPGNSSATVLRSASLRATSATRASAFEKAWARSRPSPRPAPVITTRLPDTSAPAGNDAGISICSAIAPFGRRIRPVCTDQYNTRLVGAGRSSLRDFSSADLLEMHRRMLLIRGFEQRVAALYRDGEVPGFVHLSIGQEATAVGACWPLLPTDVITSTHRGHGHCLAKGLDPLGMFAELMAKDQGTNRGRGGSRHIADPKLGIFGANGIVAAGLPIAAGAATAAQLRADGSVAVAFFGDGAPAQGAFHEALNLAAVWRLPVVFFCENNGYAEFSPAETQHAAPLARRAAGYGVEHVAVDGNDVVATAAAMEDAVLAARAGEGPAVVEATTYRWHGHYEGDPERYRSPEEVREWEARDPLLAHERRLREAGVRDDELKALEASVAAELDGAVEAARRLSAPDA